METKNHGMPTDSAKTLYFRYDRPAMGNHRADDSCIRRWPRAKNQHAGSLQRHFLPLGQRMYLEKFATCPFNLTTLPPEGTVRDYFHTWKRTGLWDKIHDTLRELLREKAGREPTPSAGNVDSQSVKSARTAEIRGFDAGKKINGVKRHIMVDTLGLLLVIVVHAASIQYRDGAKLIFAKAKGHFPQ